MKEFNLQKYGKVIVREVNNNIQINFTLPNGIKTFVTFKPSIKKTCEEEINNITEYTLSKILEYSY